MYKITTIFMCLILYFSISEGNVTYNPTTQTYTVDKFGAAFDERDKKYNDSSYVKEDNKSSLKIFDKVKDKKDK